MIIRKIKLENVSNPSQLENLARGSGKMAIIRKTIGRRSQAIELLIDMVFFLRDMIIKINNKMVAIDISI